MSHPQPSPRPNARRNLSPNPNSRREPSPNNRPRRSIEDTSKPLLDKEVNTSGPPLAGPETDTESDDRDTVNKSYPGVDDGFFTKPTENQNPDVETIPLSPQPEVPLSPKPGDNPDMGNFPVNPPRSYPGNGRYPDSNFPYAPGFGPEIYNVPDYPPSEFHPLGESIPDINYYQQKKTLAQGMMDLALFSANANQLRYVLESYDRHPYYYPSVVFIGISLIIQVAVGIGLIWNARYNVKDQKEICIANKISNMTIIGIFIVTVVNVFISAFGVANAPAVAVATPDAG